MNIVRLAIRRPVGVSMILLALLVVGITSFQSVGLDLLPHMEFPLAAIVTVYPGADPQTVEESLTKPIEASLATVAGLQRMRSTSFENASLILIEFGWGSNLERAFRDVHTHIELIAATLPPQALDPLVVRADPSQFPLMVVAVSGSDDLVELSRNIESHVVPTLQRVPGVASVSTIGDAHEEVAVTYDSEALAEAGVTPTLLHQILAYQNTVVPAGVVENDSQRLTVRAGREIDSIEALQKQPIALRQPSDELNAFGMLALAQALPVRLADVADVERRTAPQTAFTQVNGEPAILLRVLKQSGENTVAVAARLERAIHTLAEAPNGLSFHPLVNQADLIRNSLTNVAQSTAWGALLAVIVLFLFLRRLGAIAVIAVAIPLSVIAAIAILHATNTTLNLMSLGGLALSIGMLVDNAIVVLENITRHRELGKPSLEAASDGSVEIGPAIVASTLTTLVVFIPITTLESLLGLLVRDMAIAVSAAIVASLVVALFVVPVAASRWIRATRAERAESTPTSGEGAAHSRPTYLREVAATKDGVDPSPLAANRRDERRTELAPQRLYRALLKHWLTLRWANVAIVVVIVGALVYLPGRIGMIFLPPMDGGLIRAHLTLPPGTPTAVAHERLEHYGLAIRALPGVESVAASHTNSVTEGADFMQLLEANQTEFTIVLTPAGLRDHSADEIARQIADLPSAPNEAWQIESDRASASLGEDYFPGLTLHLTGPDLNVLRSVAETVQERIAGISGIGRVRTSLTPPQPELLYRVTDRSFQGVFAGGEPLTAGQVGLSLRNHLTGSVPTHVLIDSNRLPVVLRPNATETHSIEALAAFPVPGVQLTDDANSARPKLGRISTLERTDGPQAIEHADRSRLVVVKAELDGAGLSAAKKMALSALEELEIPPGYEIRVAGIHQVIEESAPEFMGILLLAVLFVYITMAVLFESWSQPLLLMLTVPLAAVGALMALALWGHPLSVPAIVGLILLIGVSVNNGIVMVDYINQLRARGLSPRDAIVQGATARLRPILMTSLTTLFGLFPLALAVGEGSEFQVPMAIAVSGGLVFSTLLSLFVLPGVLSLVSGRSQSWERSTQITPIPRQ